ncbi:hypothetical protein [Nonomuraea sp. NPDC049784]|uniref:hypothetical protein n=1 Tax=Nonomuraea sp. NPDC049784 TaxID=3154361 RepID=UPI0033FE44A2
MFIRRLGISVAGAAGLVAAMGVTAPLQADTCPQSTTCPTTVTFTVTAEDGLSITVPGPTPAVNIGDSAPGGQISGQLGSVTVTDQRAALTATWVASVIAATGGFTTGTGTAPETIPNADVDYWSGTATATSGAPAAAFAPGQANAAAAQSLDTSRTAFSKTSGSGDNSCTWNPTLVVHVPTSAVAGTYTGTVNHSVV